MSLFQTGNIPWNKGLVGKIKFPNRKSPPPFTDEHKRMAGIASGKARRGKPFSEEHKIKLRVPHIVVKKYKHKLTQGYQRGHRGMIGRENPRWIEDRTKLIKKQERNDSAYKEWRYQVFKRDRHKCKINNKDCNLKVVAHHILSWKDYPELRYEVNNGITLCQYHHPRKKIDEQRLISTLKELILSKEQ
jgi:hypothetical protein